MKVLNNLPIKRKLTVISMVTIALALLIACTAFIVNEQITFKRDITRDLGITARIIGFNSASALSFNDSESAVQTLQGLAAHPHVIRGCVYDAEGNVFATYARTPQPEMVWPRPGEASTKLGEKSLELFHTIHFAGDTSGTIYVESDLDEMHDRRWRYIAIALAVFVAALFLTWLIARRLQRVIADPIAQLVAIASRVGAEKDYSVRATKIGDDEIGRLIDGFNEMLAQIQARDTQLDAARQNLERRVEERTLSLEKARSHAALEKQRFQFIFDFVSVGISLYSEKPGFEPSYLINDAHLRICGLTREKTLTPRVFETITPAEDLPWQREYKQRLQRGEIDRFSFEKRYLRPDGHVVWVVFSSQRKVYADGRVETLCTIVDITDLKHAQEVANQERARFKFIFDSLPVGIAWMLHARPETRIVNASLSRITGVPREKRHDLSVYAKITHPDDHAAQAQWMNKLHAGEVDRFTLEKRYMHPDGTVTWASLTVRLLEDANGGKAQQLTTVVDITEAKRAEEELKRIHRQLLETSRQAGMAEVATGVLHNVGNVLNSVNVSATLVADQLRRSKIPNLGKLHELLSQHRDDLGRFLTEDPKGRMIPDYLGTLSEALTKEQSSALVELESLRKHIDHIKGIVVMQQTYAKTSGVVEPISLPDLVEDALDINVSSLTRHAIQLVRDYQARPVVMVDKSKTLQILVNLVRNAKFACAERGNPDKLITVRTTADERVVRIAVIDNGVGIPKENLTRIFAHGFTTRKNGHGFGLHSGALAAKEMGGALIVHSDGAGLGATFTLELPLKPETGIA